jgi:hypothetical protein
MHELSSGVRMGKILPDDLPIQSRLGQVYFIAMLFNVSSTESGDGITDCLNQSSAFRVRSGFRVQVEQKANGFLFTLMMLII